MGQSSSFELYGWRADGSPLSVRVKRKIQDVVLDAGVMDYGTYCNRDKPYIMSFGDESFDAYGNVTDAISAYAKSNPDTLLELYYSCEEENVFCSTRFKGDEIETHDRVELYPPFTKLTFDGDSYHLPVVEFRFEATDDKPAASFLVLLDHCPVKSKLEELEDSISSYIDSVPAYGYEQLIHDVLSEDNIGHWIIKPKHTIDI